MLLLGVAFVVFAVMNMDSTLAPPFPMSVMRMIYRIYPIVTAGLFVLSFFVKDNK